MSVSRKVSEIRFEFSQGSGMKFSITINKDGDSLYEYELSESKGDYLEVVNEQECTLVGDQYELFNQWIGRAHV